MLGFRFLAVVAACWTATAQADTLPVVDLGYAVHRATLQSTGYQYYNFSNIRFGAPTTGNARFRAPTPPQTVDRTINDGQKSVICPQADPLWEFTQFGFIAGAPLSQLQNLSAAFLNPFNVANIPQPNVQTAEDCLFLDVIVPTGLYGDCGDDQKRNVRGERKAPVVVWFYGGGYVVGSKNGRTGGPPQTLLQRATDAGSDGIIYVTFNYRVGLYGWLAGNTFKSDGTENAGLYDQELALQWVQKYIHLFGGNKNDVTIMGESAGGGAVMHQITAYGGPRRTPLFKKAIPQSPYIRVTTSSAPATERMFQLTLEQATLITGRQIMTLAALRGLSETELYLTNAAVISTMPYGEFTYGPVIDGKYIPDAPTKLLSQGRFDTSLKLMVGHNSDEGLLFSSPFVNNETDFLTALRNLIPTATNTQINYISQTLYPPVFDGTRGYTTMLQRLDLLNSEFQFLCNARAASIGFGPQSYAYYFAVPRGNHGDDTAYTFYNGGSGEITPVSGVPVDPVVAGKMQDYLTSFIKSGNPNENVPGLQQFPTYGAGAQTQLINITAFGTQVTDTGKNARCDYWIQADYF